MWSEGGGWLGGCWGFGGFAIRACGSIPAGIVRHPGEVVGGVRAGGGAELPDRAGGRPERGAGDLAPDAPAAGPYRAESALPSFLAVAVLVELGPILAGLLVASRMVRGWRPSWARWSSTRRSTPARPWAPTPARPGRPASDRVRAGRPVIDGDHRRLGDARRPGAELTAGKLDGRAILEQGAGLPGLDDIIPATLKTSSSDC